MTDTLLPCVEIEPTGGSAQSTVLWLHGLGADGHDFEPIVPYLGLQDRAVRFVFPHAPRMAVTINQGMVMPAWYDIRELDLERRPDEEGLRRSARRVTDLIVRENERGVPTSHIVLAGFSQGGALALHLGLRYPEKLAGILALSTYLISAEVLESERSPANADTPIFQAHGRFDPVVPVENGQATYERLKAAGHPVEWRVYPMEHQVHPEEIEHIGEWLQERIPGDVS